MTDREVKAGLRQGQLAALREMSAIQRRSWSGEIVARILQHPWWLSAKVVMIYSPISNEPDLMDLMGRGKRLIFPKISPTGLSLHEVTVATQLLPTTRWLSEPDAAVCPIVSVNEIQLAFIPGLAFARTTGVRLGRGGGYYDRLLAQPEFTGHRVGVCFQQQVFHALPKEPHDLTVSEVLTEQERICVLTD